LLPPLFQCLEKFLLQGESVDISTAVPGTYAFQEHF
jgi:hypothetical protein